MYNHLKVPESWNSYFSKYPQGLTIMEALLDWVGQVDVMVDDLNDIDIKLEEFYSDFGTNLDKIVKIYVEQWASSDEFKEYLLEIYANQLTALDNKITAKRDKSVLLTQSDLSTISESHKLTMNHLSQDVKNAISGTAPVSPDLADKSVTHDKLSMTVPRLVKSKNLFNKYTTTKERYIGANGTLTFNTAYQTSDFILVSENTVYCLKSATVVAFYNSSQTFISSTGAIADSSFTTPTSTAYIRFSFANAELDLNMLVSGTKLPPKYIEYEILRNSDLPEIQTTDLAFQTAPFQNTKNLIDLTKLTVDRYLVNGVPTFSSAGFSITEFIECDSNTDYTCSNNGFGSMHFFDASKTFISAVETATATTPTNAKYIRITIKNSNKNVAQLEKGNIQTTYETFGPKLDVSSIRGTNVEGVKAITVAPSGAMFSKISTALASISDASEKNRYIIKVANGTYQDTFRTKNWVDIVGVDKYQTIISYTGTFETWNQTSTIFLESQTKISNMTIISKDTKYPIHTDASTGSWTAEVENCLLIHNGSLTNETAAGTPVGIGLYQGQHLIIRNTEMVDKSGKFGSSGIHLHNIASSAGTGYRSLRVENCLIEGVTYGRRIYQLEGSEGQKNDVFFINNNFKSRYFELKGDDDTYKYYDMNNIWAQT